MTQRSKRIVLGLVLLAAIGTGVWIFLNGRNIGQVEEDVEATKIVADDAKKEAVSQGEALKKYVESNGKALENLTGALMITQADAADNTVGIAENARQIGLLRQDVDNVVNNLPGQVTGLADRVKQFGTQLGEVKAQAQTNQQDIKKIKECIGDSCQTRQQIAQAEPKGCTGPTSCEAGKRLRCKLAKDGSCVRFCKKIRKRRPPRTEPAPPIAGPYVPPRPTSAVGRAMFVENIYVNAPGRQVTINGQPAESGAVNSANIDWSRATVVGVH